MGLLRRSTSCQSPLIAWRNDGPPQTVAVRESGAGAVAAWWKTRQSAGPSNAWSEIGGVTHTAAGMSSSLLLFLNRRLHPTDACLPTSRTTWAFLKRRSVGCNCGYNRWRERAPFRRPLKSSFPPAYTQALLPLWRNCGTSILSRLCLQ